MATRLGLHLTARDHEILKCLARGPHDSDQLLKLSQKFDQPFPSKEKLRRRMRRLSSAGWVLADQYATTGTTQLNYYQLSPAGYQLVHGPTVALPRRRFFDPVSMTRQQHTRALTDFIVHADLAAHRRGVELTSFYGENMLRLKLEAEELWPDAAFQLALPSGEALNFLVELDCASMPVYSAKDRDSLAKKIAFYDRYQSTCAHRFRVLVVFAKEGERMFHFLETAAEFSSAKDRRLFYGIELKHFLGSTDAVCEKLFLDHCSLSQALVPDNVAFQSRRIAAENPSSTRAATAGRLSHPVGREALVRAW